MREARARDAKGTRGRRSPGEGSPTPRRRRCPGANARPGGRGESRSSWRDASIPSVSSPGAPGGRARRKGWGRRWRTSETTYEAALQGAASRCKTQLTPGRRLRRTAALLARIPAVFRCFRAASCNGSARARTLLSLRCRPGRGRRHGARSGRGTKGEPVHPSRPVVAACAAALLFATSEASLATDFIRGDSNSDGKVTISDVTRTLGWLFLGGAEPECVNSADSDDDGHTNLTDGVRTLANLFYEEQVHFSPFPGPGPDPTQN